MLISLLVYYFKKASTVRACSHTEVESKYSHRLKTILSEIILCF